MEVPEQHALKRMQLGYGDRYREMETFPQEEMALEFQWLHSVELFVFSFATGLQMAKLLLLSQCRAIIIAGKESKLVSHGNINKLIPKMKSIFRNSNPFLCKLKNKRKCLPSLVSIDFLNYRLHR